MLKKIAVKADAWVFGVPKDTVDVRYVNQAPDGSSEVSWAGLTLLCPSGFKVNMTRYPEMIEFFWVGRFSDLFGACPSVQLRLENLPAGEMRFLRSLKVFPSLRVLANLIVAVGALLSSMSLALALAKFLLPGFGYRIAGIEDLLFMALASLLIVVFIGFVFRTGTALFHGPICQLYQFTDQIVLAAPEPD